MYYHLLSTKKQSKFFKNIQDLMGFLKENDIIAPNNLENGIIIDGYFLLITDWYYKYDLLNVNLKTDINNFYELSFNSWNLLIGVENDKIVQIYKTIKRESRPYSLKEILITAEDGRKLKRVRVNRKKVSLGKLYNLLKTNTEE